MTEILLLNTPYNSENNDIVKYAFYKIKYSGFLQRTYNLQGIQDNSIKFPSRKSDKPKHIPWQEFSSWKTYSGFCNTVAKNSPINFMLYISKFYCLECYDCLLLVLHLYFCYKTWIMIKETVLRTIKQWYNVSDDLEVYILYGCSFSYTLPIIKSHKLPQNYSSLVWT